jgi:UDP-N-acetylglucosamine--N-acetylmuramyl-(pentapeptide) pyrophosphoryl-undecaprenol N-acetylglucosamine transferase
MGQRSFFFAGGGTGGHIYPAIAVAEKIVELEPTTKIHFFCSERNIDSQILDKMNLEYTKLPAKGFSGQPGRLISFCLSFVNSYRIAKRLIERSDNPVVVGVGGYVAAPVCLAGHRLKIPVALINVDIVPGRANKMIARWADEIFVQFEQTPQYLHKCKGRIEVVGCPLRKGFENPNPDEAIKQLGLDKDKHTLLVTGASSGSANINDAICALLERLNGFADSWQIVHLTGTSNFEKVTQAYSSARIKHKLLPYYDDMANLLAAADMVIGRSGAVSVAEYATAGVPSICIPYPYHKDRHQYKNASKLTEVGAAVIVDDVPDVRERAKVLWNKLKELMEDEKKRQRMAEQCKEVTKIDASLKIAEKLLKIG